jgi:hypothetical protein
MADRCTFDKAWIGPCGEPVTDRGMCAKHAPLLCVSCGAPATLSCDFDGQFVCGSPLCSGCEHMPPPPDACFGVGSGHANKVWRLMRAWAMRPAPGKTVLFESHERRWYVFGLLVFEHQIWSQA